MTRIIPLLFLLLYIPSCQKDVVPQLEHMGIFYVEPWARAITVHPLTGDILTIHDHLMVEGNDLKIQQYTRNGEFVKTLVDFENVEGGSYDYYYHCYDIIVDDNHRVHALVNPAIEVSGEYINNPVTTHFCILTFDLEGNLLKERLFPWDRWPDRPREIACSGNYLYATYDNRLWKIDMTNDNLELINLPLLPYPVERGMTNDMECDPEGRILFSSHVKNLSDSVKSQVYRYDEASGEFEKVIESPGYPRIETGCCKMPGMYFDKEGLLYLISCYGANFQIFNKELENIYSLDEPPIGDYGYPVWDVAAFDDYVYVLGFSYVHVFRWE